MIISNSSPLIYLSKLDRLYLLKDLFKKILIPNEVYDEVVVVGKQKNFYDSLKIENAIREGWIVIKEVNGFKELEMFSSEIDLGELAVIKLAKKENPELILIDDASAKGILGKFLFLIFFFLIIEIINLLINLDLSLSSSFAILSISMSISKGNLKVINFSFILYYILCV